MALNPSSLSNGARRNLPKELRKWLQPLLGKANAAETPIYLVGGCVRDLLLGRSPLDIDVVLEGPADPVARAAARAYKARLVTHEQFLTHSLVFKDGRHLDIATARTETYAEPAVLPVVEPASLQDDLFRRDFSINAIAISLNKGDFGHLWDPFGGAEDLKAGRVRVLHSDSFKDDPTRIFRAARFAGRFGFELEWRTREWLAEAVGQQLPSRLSGARLREELVPLLLEDDPRPALRLLDQWNALAFIIPGLKWDKGNEALFGQAPGSRRKQEMLVPRLLALLHGLPQTKIAGSLGHLMFPQKTIEQVEQAEALLTQLREGGLTPATAGVLRRRPLSPEMKSFLERAVKVPSLAPRPGPREDWRRLQESSPCLTGQDIRNLGYKPGPVYGRMLDALRQARWEGKLRTREEEIRFLMQTFPLAGKP